MSIYVKILLAVLLMHGVAYAQKLPRGDKLNALCDSPERQDLIAILDESYLNDIRHQAQGLKVPYEEHLSKELDAICSVRDEGGQFGTFSFAPDATSSESYHPTVEPVYEPTFVGFNFSQPVECETDWRNYCDVTFSLQLLPHLQACKLTYSIAHDHGNTKIRPSADYWLDNRRKSRFQGYRLRLRADGNNEWANQVGARITLSAVGIMTLPVYASDENRRQKGCDMPDNPRAPVIEPEPEPTPAPENSSQEPVRERICGKVEYLRHDGGSPVYKGVDFGSMSIVCGGGSWSSESISPGREYKLGPSCGWNCFVPPR